MGESGHHFQSPFRPSPEQVTDLIERARAHPLGLDFLRNGSQDAVAALFGVHAFTVDAARRHLEGGTARER
jgi:hypothetical protein